MNEEFNEAPDQKPIVFIFIVMGLLSFLSTFQISGLQAGSLSLFDITSVAGIICGLFAWPLGLKLSNKRRTKA